MPYMSVNSYVGLGIETTVGTPSSNIKWLPVTSPQVTPQQMWLRDEAYRGSAVAVYNTVLGVRHDEYDFKGHVFADTFGLLAKATLGYEAITGSSPYTHTTSLLKNTTGSQPPSVTIQDFDGANPFQITAGQLADLKVTFGAEAALEYEAKFMGNPFTVLTSNPTASFSTDAFIPAWDVSLTINGTAVTVLIDGEIALTRGTSSIFTAAGTYAPYRNFAGPINATGRMKFVVESNDPILYGNATTVATTTSLVAGTPTTLPVTASTNFSSTGGAGVLYVGSTAYTIAYTGTSAGNLTGVTVTNGNSTVSATSTSLVAPNSNGLVDNAVPVVLTFTNPTAPTETVKFQMSSVQFFNPKRSRSKAYVEVDAEFVALANTTDATSGAGGGYSPIQIAAVNSVSAVY